jgi:hypothetical protein
MILDTWLSVLLFLLFVAPGLLFDMLSERRRASYTESAFREASRVALASLAFSLTAVAVLGGIRAIVPKVFPDPGDLLAQNPGTYAAHHYGQIFLTLVAQVALACGAASVFDRILGKRKGSGSIRKISAWQMVLRQKLPKGHEAYVRVRLSSGIVYTGLVFAHSPDFDLDNRELILTQPMSSKLPGGTLTPVPSQFKTVTIVGTLIETMSVEYREIAARRHGAQLAGAKSKSAAHRPSFILSRLHQRAPVLDQVDNNHNASAISDG